MWYVIQVRTGTEEEIVRQCRNEYRGEKIEAEVLRGCFIPYVRVSKKLHGVSHTIKKVMFPGYVFLDADDTEALYMELKKVNGLTKLLAVGDEVVPLSEKETAFLMRFGGPEHVVEMSEGIIENSKVRILSGPLMGLETMIRKIDRHKKKAWVEMEMLGEMRLVQVGLDVPMKTV